MAKIPLTSYGRHTSYWFDPETGAYQVHREHDFRWPPGVAQIGYGAEVLEGLFRHRSRLLMALYEDGQTLRFAVGKRSVDILDPRISIVKKWGILQHGFTVREDGQNVLSVTYSFLAWIRMTDAWDGTDLIDYIRQLRAEGPAAIEPLRDRWRANRAALP